MYIRTIHRFRTPHIQRCYGVRGEPSATLTIHESSLLVGLEYHTIILRTVSTHSIWSYRSNLSAIFIFTTTPTIHPPAACNGKDGQPIRGGKVLQGPGDMSGQKTRLC